MRRVRRTPHTSPQVLPKPARDRLIRLAPLVVPLVLIVVILGPHLIGVRSLAPTDQLYSWEPWLSEKPADLTPTHAAPFSDNFDSVFPTRNEVARRIRGDFPLWSYMSGGGADLAVNIGSAAAAVQCHRPVHTWLVHPRAAQGFGVVGRMGICLPIPATGRDQSIAIRCSVARSSPFRASRSSGSTGPTRGCPCLPQDCSGPSTGCLSGPRPTG